jgi:hypothetical protein
MKVFAILALAAAAVAVPTEAHAEHCTPGTYSCTRDHLGWRVCATSTLWVYAGACPPKTHCYFNKENQSPYCI